MRIQQKAHPPRNFKKTKKQRYVDENTVNFVVMNKVGGFLQRIDYARKYAFGAMCILKDDKGQFPIRGAWIFRGQAIPPMMVEVRYVFYMLFSFLLGSARASGSARNRFLIMEEQNGTRIGGRRRHQSLSRQNEEREKTHFFALSLSRFSLYSSLFFKSLPRPPPPLFQKQECYDLDLYNWTKVDVNDAAQKKRVEDMFAEEATIDGLEHIECKIFK